MKYTIDCIIPVYNQEHLIRRALDSVPKHWNIIIINDGSTDNTHEEIQKFINNDLYRHERHITYIINKINMGVGISVNSGYDVSKGDYIVLLGSDDYFLPEISKVEEEINGFDMIFFNMIDNDGKEWKLNERTVKDLPGSVKFIRRDFIGDERTNGARQGEDMSLMQKLQEKPHTYKFTNIIAKHYNFPREGSLTWEAIHGKK